MTDSDRRWWFSADKQWQRGEPPQGWYQAVDGRWYPPEAQPTAPLPIVDGEADPSGREEGADDENVLPAPVAWGVIGTLAVVGLIVVLIGALSVTSGSTGEDAAPGAADREDEAGGSAPPSSASPPEATGADGPDAADTAVTDGADEPDGARDAAAGEQPADADGAEGPGDEPSGDGGPTDQGSSTSTTTTTTTASGQEDDADDCRPWAPPGRPDRPLEHRDRDCE